MKGYLLDTHVLIWWWTDNPRLGRQARAVLQDPANTLFLSSVSVWEIVVKRKAGRLELAGSLAELAADPDFQPLPITSKHAALVETLPDLHRDPFDRMLIAQAKCDDLVLVSADRAVQAYPVDLLPAGN